MSTSPQVEASNIGPVNNLGIHAASEIANGAQFPSGPYSSGMRHSFLSREATRLRKEGKQKAQIKKSLSRLNEQHNQPPLPEEDVDRVAKAVINLEKAIKRNHRTKAKR
jgi:hypothetical protein